MQVLDFNTTNMLAIIDYSQHASSHLASEIIPPLPNIFIKYILFVVRSTLIVTPEWVLGAFVHIWSGPKIFVAEQKQKHLYVMWSHTATLITQN